LTTYEVSAIVNPARQPDRGRLQMQHTIQIHKPPATADEYAESRYGQLLNATHSAARPGQHHDPRDVWQLYATNNAGSTKRATVYQDGDVLFVTYAHDISWEDGEEWAAEGFADSDSARRYADRSVR
jgi:hypothetical protein